MTPADYAVATLRNAIAESTGVDPAFKRAMQHRALESTVARFCQFCVETNVQVGAGLEFNRRFADLCAAVGFDADDYAAEGFDRKDV